VTGYQKCISKVILYESLFLPLLDFEVRLFYRYVDDTFAIVPRDKLSEVLRVFNSYHTRLSFTYELESNDVLSFLNTTVHRVGLLVTNRGKFDNNRGRPDDLDRDIYYRGHSPESLRRVILTIYIKVKVIGVASVIVNIYPNWYRKLTFSGRRFHETNIKIVEDVLLNNCFPIALIRKVIKQRVKKLKVRTSNDVAETTLNNDNKKQRITLPYCKLYSDMISCNLRENNFDVAFSVPKKLNCLIRRGKNRLDLNNCKDCDASYIGQTKSSLETRVNEHRRNINGFSKYHSVVTDHRLAYDHDFDWLNPKVLHREKHWRKRQIAEMFFIKSFDNTINLQTHTENLNTVYLNSETHRDVNALRRKEFITIPFVKGISERLTRILKNCRLFVTYTVPNKLDSLIKRCKDSFTNDKKTCVVYKINCSDCQACYIRQTKRHLEQRVKEHKTDIKKDQDSWSIVSRHSGLNGHCFDWSNVNVLHHEKHLRRRELAEMICY
ncbi:hypothetical protein X777_01102, partial [Ooceraea biroi]